MTGKSASGTRLASSLFNSDMKNLLLTSETERGASAAGVRISWFCFFCFFCFKSSHKSGKKDELKAMMSVLCVPNFKHSNVGDSTAQRSVVPITKQSTS